MNGQLKKMRLWLSRKENIVIIIGSVIAVIAIATPFSILLLTGWNISYKQFNKLGVVGDFFGGTTVGLLSLASIIFVIAAIVMQKEELALQREEVRKTREEYEITNQTMKKQQFENTFFNMLNLHQSIVKEIKLEGKSGRQAFETFYERLRNAYNDKIYNDYKNEVLEELSLMDDNFINTFALELNIDRALNSFIQSKNYSYRKEKLFKESVLAGENEEWELIKKQKIKEEEEQIRHYSRTLKIDIIRENLEFLNNLSFNNEIIDKFNENFTEDPHIELKIKAYELVYKEYSPHVGHYFRNLYRIVRLIEDESFSKDENVNITEKSKYRGILRAQLSSMELLMIFYNVVYSSKGRGFKLLLKKKNFFDDHLSKEDFIWNNDINELNQL
ncbi:putative phage abortive infection protein [Cytobacillus firmus]|uniref:putative phage abortive infection protein n=1 Tax=Cytobacillus firmus TaxID=1399 RepID=UPI0018CDD43C|nr:putative phage abortive infection protein [Cytobacillus firmus]